MYILLCLTFQAFWIPLSLGLNLTTSGYMKYIEYSMIVTFLFDILMNFNTSVNDKGSIIKDRKLIAKAYLRSWFTIDILASFPYELILDLAVEDENE